MSPYVEVLDLLVHVAVRSCACKDDSVNFSVKISACIYYYLSPYQDFFAELCWYM